MQWASHWQGMIVGVCGELHVKSGGAMSNDLIVGFLNLEILVDKISAWLRRMFKTKYLN